MTIGISLLGFLQSAAGEIKYSADEMRRSAWEYVDSTYVPRWLVAKILKYSAIVAIVSLLTLFVKPSWWIWQIIGAGTG